MKALLDLRDEVSWAVQNYLDFEKAPAVQNVLNKVVERAVASAALASEETQARVKEYLKVTEALKPVQCDSTAVEEQCDHPYFLADFHVHPRKYVSPDGEEVAFESELPSEGDVKSAVSLHLVFSVSDGMYVYSTVKGKTTLLRKYRVQVQPRKRVLR